MKKIFISLFLFLALIISGCSTANNQKNNENKESNNPGGSTTEIVKPGLTNTRAVVVSENTAVDAVLKDKVVYTNKDYGFTLIFPSSWEGFVVSNRKISWGENGESDSLDFGFADDKKLLNISVLTPTQWMNISKEAGPKPTYLGRNANSVFTISFSGAPKNDSRAQLIKEISDSFSKSGFFSVIR